MSRYSAAFRDWFVERSAERDWQRLFDYRRSASYAPDMPPNDEQLLPWYAAAGCCGRDAVPLRLHVSHTFGCQGMDVYAFCGQAAALVPTMSGDAALASA